MKINVMRQRAGLWVDEGDFDIVALMHHNQRVRYAAVESQGSEFCTVRCNGDEFFTCGHAHCHNLGAAFGNLIMRRC